MKFNALMKVFSPIGVLCWIAIFYIVFALAPSLDIHVSSYFYDPQGGFRLKVDPEVRFARRLLFYVIISGAIGAIFFMLVLAVVPSILPVWFQKRGKIFEVVSLVYLLGPILLVNGILKEYWGRARPTNIKEFAGSLEFTPPFEVANQCLTNCSFVSGEAAGATAYLVGAALIYSVSNRNWVARSLASLVTLGAVSAMGLRVVMGGHFLSDTIFSFLFVVLITSLLFKLKRYRQILK